PDDLLERWVRRDQLSRRLDRERIELLEARDGDGFRGGAVGVSDDVVVDLPGAEDEPPDALFVAASRVVEHRLPTAVSELAQRRRRFLEAQQALRGHHDEWPRGRDERLAAQHVEVLRGRRA